MAADAGVGAGASAVLCAPLYWQLLRAQFMRTHRTHTCKQRRFIQCCQMLDELRVNCLACFVEPVMQSARFRNRSVCWLNSENYIFSSEHENVGE